MNTPILDFLRAYSDSGTARFHMPGHKGVDFIGCEHLDITEIQGADALYEAEGIIKESEANASALFDSGMTVYSAEGSSQCIRAMLYLALANRPDGAAPLIVAARNVHKSFVYAAALLDFKVEWLWPEGENHSLCGCNVTAEGLEKTLKGLDCTAAAVYITSPDYLGSLVDIRSLADVCHRYGTLLMVDNAHGAYLHFLTPPIHPLDLGADLCCDSAHKTLPVLTGGAYLHISKRVSGIMAKQVKMAMALFGSTSPSYLIMASLDNCNSYLSRNYPVRLAETVDIIENAKLRLRAKGWHIEKSDPLKLTITAPKGLSGVKMAETLRNQGIECEYADPESLVLMLTPENEAKDLERIISVLGENTNGEPVYIKLPTAKGRQITSIREALFAPHEQIMAENSLGRICGAPTVACPPAIPVAVSGEEITREALELFKHYGIEYVDVLKQNNAFGVMHQKS